MTVMVVVFAVLANIGISSLVYFFGHRVGRRLGYAEGWRDRGVDEKANAEAAMRPRVRFAAAFREVDSKTMPIDLESKAKETEP